jgi:hypothetical protein
MPYDQFFDGGQAFHVVNGSICTTVGSMGGVRAADGSRGRRRRAVGGL